MDTKLLGGTLLVVGTSIGAGMLALPIANSYAGFIYSSFLLLACWFIMTAGALLILEINLWLEENSNIISMAKMTLGPLGQIIAWITYLVLLYSLLSAYMAGGADFLQHLLVLMKINIPQKASLIIFTILLSVVVYHGIRSVDYVNRGLMLTKFSSLVLLIILILPFISGVNLLDGEFRYITLSTTVALTSFGFANIIPSLRTYFQSDRNKLRKAILIGSLIPLFCYLIWDLVIMGTIPRTGTNGLVSMAQSGHSTSEFVKILSDLLQRETITVIARIFTSICLATSFLGVSLSLFDFLADGLRISKDSTSGKLLIYLATFLPPLLIVLFYPGIFITALSYAGVDCTILLVLMPVLMVWRGRYQLRIAHGYQVQGGKPLLILLVVASVLIMAQSLIIGVG